ncbi:MAG: hypothetical protein WC575_03320 [Patescibacteria group bacterium]
MDQDDLIQKNELESPEEQAQASAQYAEQRQQEVVQRQKQAQAESGDGKGRGRIGQVANAAMDVAKTQVKKQVKKAVLKWIAGALIALFGNPITWIVIIAILILVLAYACASDVTQCVQIIGLDAVIDIVGKM